MRRQFGQMSLGHGSLDIEKLAPIGKGIRRDIDNPHNAGAYTKFKIKIGPFKVIRFSRNDQIRPARELLLLLVRVLRGILTEV